MVSLTVNGKKQFHVSIVALDKGIFVARGQVTSGLSGAE